MGSTTTLSLLTRYLVVKVDINIFAEGVSFRQASGTVLHQVKGLQGAK